MVKSFRVSDLQTLLASMGRSKSGLKQDLVGRALRLVQTEYSPELLKNVRQLYESRFPKTSGWLAARRPESVSVAYSSLSSSPTATSQGADYLNGISKPIPTPAPEVKLVPLPFYQTLETLLPPTELSECIFSLMFLYLKYLFCRNVQSYTVLFLWWIFSTHIYSCPEQWETAGQSVHIWVNTESSRPDQKCKVRTIKKIRIVNISSIYKL